MIKMVPQFLALLTLLSNIFIVLLLLTFLLQKFKILNLKKSPLATIYSLLSTNSFLFSFIVSLTAMLGSLFFSEVMKFMPCVLCWYQRILMYPQTLLLYMAILRKERFLKPYLLALNVIGASIATYHYTLQKFPQTLIAPCTVVGASESCIKGYSFYFGYISIPFMALTAFILNIIFLSLTYAKNSQRAK